MHRRITGRLLRGLRDRSAAYSAALTAAWTAAQSALIITVGTLAAHVTTPAAAQAAGLANVQADVHANVPATVSAASKAATLLQVFEAAWQRQPEAAALGLRLEAAQAQQRVAQFWTPAPVAVELASASGYQSRNQDAREIEVGLTAPLWLPGERASSGALAEAQARAVGSHAAAAQLRLAATVREAWWNWQRASADLHSAKAQLGNAQRIAADVQQRLTAGDLARADLHQADAATASAESALAMAQAAVVDAQQQMLMLTTSATGQATLNLDASALSFVAEPEPEPQQQAQHEPKHAALLALQDSSAVAARASALAQVQTRTNPELSVSTTRDRGAAGEPWQQTLRLGVRIPFGAGAGNDARLAAARADEIELQAQLVLERARLAAEQQSAQARTAAARVQLAAAYRRAQLGAELRGFFQKSFSLGQTDLPTRLRIEAEAAEGERQALRARIELAAAVSAWRQALGLLPQ